MYLFDSSSIVNKNRFKPDVETGIARRPAKQGKNRTL